MTKKTIFLSILAAALLFGAATSGCNRNRHRRQAENSPGRESRREGRRDTRQASAPVPRGVRPAEVLSASAYRSRPRPPAREYLAQVPAPVPVHPMNRGMYTTSRNLDRVHEPLPEPVPVHHVFPDYPAAPVYQPSYQTAYAGPQPLQFVHPSPEFAMAQAALPASPPAVWEPRPAAPVTVPAVRPEMFAVPIPELEPVRYRRVAEVAPAAAPVAGVSARARPVAMRSGGGGDQRARALAPPPRPAAPVAGWVASPATAMRIR